MRAELLRLETQAAEPCLLLPEYRELLRGELLEVRHQEELAVRTTILEAAQQSIEEDAFVRGMLVDQHDGAGRLRHQVALQQLADVRQRRQPRTIRQVPLPAPCIALPLWARVGSRRSRHDSRLP